MTDPTRIPGRYQVLGTLGEGGMGVVYRVRDEATGAEVALKVVPRTGGRSGLSAEFAALARLEHPNIVRVFDLGRTSSGDDFFTMELVRGRDLRALAPRPDAPELYPLLAGAARALAFLHARGLVHADIKPSNLLVDEALLASAPERALKLVDFGLAAPLADPQAAAARGTFPYAAPEVYAGRLDARSDLYALGTVLYEVLAGTLPYRGDDVAAVIRAQRRAPPADPRTHRPELPAALAELVLTLLEPEPGARPQSADEVLVRLAELGGIPAPPPSSSAPPDLGGSLIGRDRDLAFLEELWGRAQAGRGQLVLLAGEEGIGKSRLCAELKLRVQLGGGRTASGRARGGGGAYGPLADLVQRLAAEHTTGPGAALIEARRTALAPLLGGPVAARLGATPAVGVAAAVPTPVRPSGSASVPVSMPTPAAGVPAAVRSPGSAAMPASTAAVPAPVRSPGSSPVPAAVRSPGSSPVPAAVQRTPSAGVPAAVRGLTPSAGVNALPPSPPAPEPERDRRFALAEALASLLIELSRLPREAPLLIVLEDVGSVGRGEAELLGYLARAAGAGRLLVVACVRVDAAGGDPPVLAALQGGVEGGAGLEGVHRLDLAPLDRASVRALLSALFRGAPALAERLAPDVQRVSGGNPAHVMAAVEGLLARGAIVRRSGAWQAAPLLEVLPVEGATAAALARYRHLAPAAQALLGDAAVLGEEVSAAALAAAAGVTPEVASTTLGGGVGARLFERSDAATWHDGDDEALVLRWQHPDVRAAIAALVAPARRLELHRAAFARLLGAQAAGLPVAAEALAEHALAGAGDLAQVTRHVFAAADARRSALDLHGALAWLERLRPTLAAGATRPGDARTAAALADLDERAGDLSAALGDTTIARTSYEAAAAGVDAIANVSAADATPGNSGPIMAATQAAGRLARKLGELLRRGGDSDLAIDRLQAALSAARRARRDGDEAGLHLTLGRVRMYRGEYAAALEHATAGMVLARAAGDHGLASRLGRLRGVVELFRGDARAATPNIEAALDDAGRGGSERDVADALGDLGHACFRLGDYPRAIECFERALPIDERLGLVEQSAKILNNLGIACFFQGQWARARESWERFRDLCERVGEATELVNALNNLGQLYKDQGDFALALSTLDRGARLAERVGHAHLSATILGNRGEVLARQGDHEGARACYERCARLFADLGAREDALENTRRLCELELAAGRAELALDRALDAARDAKQQGAKLEEAALHRVAAACLRMCGDLDSAAWFLDRGRELASELGATYESARIDLEAAELSIAKSEIQDAEAHATRAAQGFAALGARWDLARARERRRWLTDPAGGAGGASPDERGRAALGGAGFEVVLDIARAAGRIELDRLLEIVLEKILEATRFDRGFILLLDERGRPTERKRRVRAGEADSFQPEEAQFSASVVKRVAETGEPLAVTDIDADVGLRAQRSVIALGLRSVLCAPMRRHGRVIGIVYVDSRKLADVDDERQSRVGLALLEALAAQAAIAVENARLIAEEQRKTELMAVLAHEIRNPLSSILGFSELNEEERASLPPDIIDMIERIHRDGERLRRLVDNVLEMARVEAGKVEWSMAPVDLGKVARDLAASFAPQAEKREVRLVTEIAPVMAPALGSSDRIYQVLTNLLANALKFTPAGGTITLRVREEALAVVDEAGGPGAVAGDDLAAWVPLAPGAGDARMVLRVDVADTGPGIPAERRDRLFEKFAQGESGKRKALGLGLGLFISREIIRRHGGTIWVESELGQGSTFSFRLPRAAAPR